MKNEMKQCRARLAAAIVNRTEAEACVSASEAAHQRAASLLAKAEKAVSAASANAQTAADNHAALLADRLRKGERVDLLVPADDAVRAARLEAERRRDVAKLAEAGLSAELAGARERLSHAQAAVEAAVYDVLIAERDELIERVERLQREERAARHQLQGMSYLAVTKPGAPTYALSQPRFNVTERANLLIHRRDPEYNLALHPANAAHAQWNGFLNELKLDATAQFSECK